MTLSAATFRAQADAVARALDYIGEARVYVFVGHSTAPKITICEIDDFKRVFAGSRVQVRREGTRRIWSTSIGDVTIEADEYVRDADANAWTVDLPGVTPPEHLTRTDGSLDPHALAEDQALGGVS